MSIKIDWPAMSSLPDTLTIYWSDTPFTPATLPGTKTVLDSAAVTYTDTTVADRGIRYYMVEAIKAGSNTQYSQCMLFGNFSKTGPGGNTVLRGNWDAGYMGFIPAAQMFTISGLRTALGSPSIGTAPADGTMTGWYKFVYKGKILFFPNNIFTAQGTATWSQIYNAGLAYGVDGPGAAPFNLVSVGAQPAIAAPVNQKKVVTIGTDSFLVRLPKNSTLPTDQSVPDRSSFPGCEWWSTMAMMTSSAPDAADAAVFPTNRWNDVSGVPYPLAAVQHFQSTANFSVHNGNWTGVFPRAITTSASGGWISWVPVLELIPA